MMEAIDNVIYMFFPSLCSAAAVLAYGYWQINKLRMQLAEINQKIQAIDEQLKDYESRISNISENVFSCCMRSDTTIDRLNHYSHVLRNVMKEEQKKADIASYKAMSAHYAKLAKEYGT